MKDVFVHYDSAADRMNAIREMANSQQVWEQRMLDFEVNSLEELAQHTCSVDTLCDNLQQRVKSHFQHVVNSK